MTQQAVTPWVFYTGTGVLTTFAYPFAIATSSDLQVFLDGVLTTAYTLTGVGSASGGNVVFTTAPANNVVIFIRRVTPQTQLTDYVSNDPFDAAAHENALDKLTRQVQDLEERLSRMPQQVFDTANALRSLVFPAGSNKVLAWNSDGSGLTLLDPATATTPVTDPALIDDSSGSLTQYRSTTNPGGLGTESLPTNLAGEVGRLRYQVLALCQALDPFVTQWYQTPRYVNAANVRSYGATGDGVTDDTAAIQACMDANKRVYFPPGTYLIKGVSSQSLDGLKLASNHELFGDGITSILKQDATSQYALSANQYNGGTSSVSGNKTNIFLHDLQFLATVATDAFSEHKHLVNLNAVSTVLVERCLFKGFRGDGLYIGSGNQAGIERHNQFVTVRKCTFDGVNSDNRNAISIVDCEGFLADDCDFLNCTRSNMPGAIDFEPNPGVAYAVGRGLVVRNCRFYNIGGNVAAVSFIVPDATLTTAPEQFIIENCLFNTCDGFAMYFSYQLTGGITSSTADFGVIFRNNRVKSCLRPFALYGAKDAHIVGNSFASCPNAALVGFNATKYRCRDVVIRDNIFRSIGTTDGIGLAVYYCDQLDIIGNKFQDCGTAGGYGIDFNTGTSSYVRLVHNLFTTPGGTMTVAVQKEAGHTFGNNGDGNQCLGNDFGGLTHNFRAWRTDAVQVVQCFDTTTLPDSFPVGVSRAVINGDTGAPDVSDQGLLTTYRISDLTGYRKFTYQEYKPAGNDATSKADVWRRNATSGANTWEAWYRMSGTTVAVTTYTPTNVLTDRSYDANATTTDELADVLGTLIADLQQARIIA